MRTSRYTIATITTTTTHPPHLPPSSSSHSLPSPADPSSSGQDSQSPFSSSQSTSSPKPSLPSGRSSSHLPPFLQVPIPLLLFLFLSLPILPGPCLAAAAVVHIPPLPEPATSTAEPISSSASTSTPNPKSGILPAAVPKLPPSLVIGEETEQTATATDGIITSNSSSSSSASNTVVLVTNITAAFPDLAAAVPACGLRCIIDLAPNASSCLLVEQQEQYENNEGRKNDTSSRIRDSHQRQKDCLCAPPSEEDNLTYYPSVLSCVSKHCDMEEAIETARGAWETCGKDGRSRKADMWAPLSIEIPALFCALLRLYSRWWSVSKFEADDYIMMVVVVLFIPFEIIGIYAAQSAFGRDIWTVGASKLTISLKLFYVGESFYLAILTLTKLSILVFYLRIFPNPTFRAVSYAVMVWVALSGIISVFVQIFQCTPISFIWEGWKRGQFGPYRCLDVNALGFTTAAFGIAQDLAIIVMPLPLLAKLNVSRRCRLGIMIMFSLGVFVLITSCVRLWSLYSFGESANPTWDYTDVIIWTGLEVAVSIIVTSLPAIRVLINRRMPGILGSMLGGGGGGLGGGGIWGPDGEYRGYGRRSDATSTSSFGDTTFVGSMYSSGMPALKRLSAISHVSSLKVERLTGSSWTYEEEDEKGGATGERGERVGGGMFGNQAVIDFGGEKGSEETRRTRSETEDSYTRSIPGSFDGEEKSLARQENDDNSTMARLWPRPLSPKAPLKPGLERSESQASTFTAAAARPLPHPPARSRSQLQSQSPSPSRALPYPPARSPSQIRPRGPRPLSQPDRVKMLRRGGPIVPLPNIADVLRTERSAESLPAHLPSQESGVIPVGMRAMTIRKVEEGT